MAKANKESELITFQLTTERLSTEDLDRDFAELSSDIQFLDAQIASDLETYSTEELERAIAKTALLKLKAEIIVLEMKKRRERPKEERKFRASTMSQNVP